jgi:predicted dehydrogenase
LGANDRIGVGLIGAGNQGRFDFSSMIRTEPGESHRRGGCLPTAARPDARCHRGAAGQDRGLQRLSPLLERKDIDAVIVATPEHWHGIPMIMACEAGKDVYVEKPISHTIYEGRKMVEAASKYNRVVTCGTQQRSGEHYQKVVEMIRGGKIGKVTFVEAWLHGGGFTRENRKQSPPPDSDPPRDSIGISGLDPRPTIITIAAAGDSRASGKPVAAKPPIGDRT